MLYKFAQLFAQAAGVADYQAGPLKDTEADQEDYAAHAAGQSAPLPPQHAGEKTGAPPPHR